MKESHPYNLIHRIPPETKTLIIGTAPPPRFKNFQEHSDSFDFDFFYGSENNYMWPILEEALIGKKALLDEMSSNECKATAIAMLKSKRLWMRDVLQLFARKNDASALDDNIEIIKDGFTDFKATLDEGGKISMFAFTSERAATWTLDAIEHQQLSKNIDACRSDFKKWRAAKGETTTELRQFYMTKYTSGVTLCDIGGRKISLVILPTPTARGPRGMTLEIKKEIYKKILASIA